MYVRLRMFDTAKVLLTRNIVIIEARLYNKDEELCTEALCTYFTFPKEKAREEMHFLSCEVEDEEILPLI